MRASELCDLRLRDVRLHDHDGARFRIVDAKTEAGVREVQMTPDLVEAFVEHLDRLRRAGLPTGPDDYAVPNRSGGRMSRQRVGQIVGEAAALASERNEARGMPPMPPTTPHSLRRTYISIALLANNFDVKWVMSQVGHADSKMTLDIYAQLEQRIQRDHGVGFDRLVRQARGAAGRWPGTALGGGVEDSRSASPTGAAALCPIAVSQWFSSKPVSLATSNQVKSRSRGARAGRLSRLRCLAGVGERDFQTADGSVPAREQ
ncbi:MAG: tyrosine-type recombinase/integrase [Actinomycetota bacterium]|nr:tyrosine-type recombinase/integrase [Actinomycetota bacterium]